MSLFIKAFCFCKKIVKKYSYKMDSDVNINDSLWGLMLSAI